MRGRPTLLGQKLDTLVQKFLRATRYKDRVVNTQTALATAKVLVKRYPLPEKENLVLGAPWAKSRFGQSADSRRIARRTRIEISPGNFQLRGEVPDATIANYQLWSDTLEIRPDFFK